MRSLINLIVDNILLSRMLVLSCILILLLNIIKTSVNSDNNDIEMYACVR